MSKRIKELESENTKLRQRIAELEAANRGSQQGGAGVSLPTPAQVSRANIVSQTTSLGHIWILNYIG